MISQIWRNVLFTLSAIVECLTDCCYCRALSTVCIFNVLFQLFAVLFHHSEKNNTFILFLSCFICYFFLGLFYFILFFFTISYDFLFCFHSVEFSWFSSFARIKLFTVVYRLRFEFFLFIFFRVVFSISFQFNSIFEDTFKP